jgi:UDP-glucose 4-epimerase
MKLNNSKKNILVTGGAGFVGSIFCSHLKKKYKKYFNIFVIDNLSSGKKKYINCDKFYQFNLEDNNRLNNFFENNKIDIVVHLAAYTNLRDNNLKKFNTNNYLATKSIVESIIKFNVRKLIFSSTAAVYGNPNNIPIIENAILNPISYYGKSKLKAEKFIQNNSKNNYKSVIFRFFNAAGANINFKIGEDKSPPEHLIPIVIRNTLNGIKNKIYSNFRTKDGTGIRDYVHVDDICEALIKSLFYFDKMKINTEIFNLGSGNRMSSLMVVNKIQYYSKKKIDFIFTNKKKGEPDHLLSSISKVKKMLNWKPKKNMNKILKDSLYWEKYIDD